MSAPNLQYPPASGGGTPVGGAGTPGTIPLWNTGTSLKDSAVTQTDGAILSVTLTSGGTGYTNGNYPQVALTNVTGTGTGATADIIVAGGIVTTVILRSPGQGYAVSDTLSCASIGAGSNFLVTVATTASILRSDGSVVAPRIGAGNTSPRAALDVAGQGYVNGFGDLIETAWSGFTVPSNVSFAVMGTHTPTRLYRGIVVDPLLSASGGATNFTGYSASPNLTTSAAGTGVTITGVSAAISRSWAGDLSTTGNITAYVANTNVLATLGAASTSSVTSYQANFTLSYAGHPITTATGFGFTPGSIAANITTFYGLRLAAASGAGTITNRYNIAQEDTLGANYFRSKTFFGPAVGTAGATNASVEVTAQGTLTGDVRLNSASAVFDASNSSTNGTKYYNRGGAGISSTTQSYYEEGSYTPTTTNYTLGTFTATWTRIGRKVFLTINSAAGVNNGTTTTGAASISLPAGLAPARSGLGLRGQPNGSASGNGMVGINAATGLLEISTTVTLDTNAKCLQAEYEV